MIEYEKIEIKNFLDSLFRFSVIPHSIGILQ